jgi:DNA-binding transcriptional regulator YhcF (GntR family)
MPLRVTRDGPLSIAGQIGTQLRGLIHSGRLRPGDRLPPVRVLAGFLRVNRNTVAKVYASLERAGVVSTTPGRG